MFRFRRLVDAALEDFGLRRTVEVTPPAPPAPRTPPPTIATEVHQLPFPPEDAPHVVFHGSALRRPELHRFCEHLELLRTSEPAARVLQA